MLKVKCGLHNHQLAETLLGHSYVGRLSEEEKKLVHEMTRNNVKPRNVLLTVKGRDKENLSTIRHIYNERQRYRSSQRGPRTEMQNLLNLVHRDRYVSWHRKQEGLDVVKDIFWAHADSVHLLNTFNTVIILDSTYKTNKYRLPLLEIVGVTSTELTFTVGFAYMDSEGEENYVWALEKLRELYVLDESVPQVVVTDRDLALMNAVAFVFPTSQNLLCLFHIGKNVYAKCKKLVSDKKKIEVVKDAWNSVVYATDEELYEQRLMSFQDVCAGNLSNIVIFVIVFV